jgi:hypothetical protein
MSRIKFFQTRSLLCLVNNRVKFYNFNLKTKKFKEFFNKN